MLRGRKVLLTEMTALLIEIKKREGGYYLIVRFLSDTVGTGIKNIEYNPWDREWPTCMHDIKT